MGIFVEPEKGKQKNEKEKFILLESLTSPVLVLRIQFIYLLDDFN